MTTWIFRLRFRIAPTSGLSVPEPKMHVDACESVGPLELEVWPRSSGVISETEWLQLTGGAASEVEARDRGMVVSHALQQAFARLRVAADFGRRNPRGRFTEFGKSLVPDNGGRPVLDDEHGLMVYQTKPAPRLVSVGAVTPKLIVQEARLCTALEAALRQRRPVTEQEAIAYDLFAASFFDASPDARLISLVVAIEALLQPVERGAAARMHVERIIKETRAATELESKERDSLVGSLRWLHQESITATGDKFVRETLGQRTYGGCSAEKLWKKAYALRSKLVHGSVPRPSRDEVGRYAASLEVMVSHLLSGPLLDIDV